SFQESQLLQEHWPLPPGAGLVDAEAPIVVADWIFDRSGPLRHVVRGQKRNVAAAAPVHLRGPGREAIDRLGDEAAIEGVARRFDLPLAIASGRFRFPKDSLVCLGDSRSGEQGARRRWSTAG